jgi:small-conductance mechanosensitive channel
VIGIGLALDLSGYQSFAVYWLVSWGLSTVFFLWFILSFLILREWRLQLKIRANEPGETGSTGHSIRWLILQLFWLIWLAGSIFGVILVWGGRQTVVANMVHLFTHPLKIGNISFSILNVVYAFLVIVLVHLLIRFWRFVLVEKILTESGFESGVQDSIAMITVYVFWVFGIITALHVLGVGTATLALAFGALGIGLGFGLQNIFNNFISGIILLFERPIQVGDDVEVKGVWATVKKINVRATVVQTYDNASLIIPNSEFISSQVTNWSFKDKRLRRNIDVGVAYGSDIELVRKTLLEIAENTPGVLKNPEPDVIFRDFGDSALIFRLRIWTDIAGMFAAETAVRFEIDRLFKERDIVIAFPQRDVHIYTENHSQPNGSTRDRGKED